MTRISIPFTRFKHFNDLRHVSRSVPTSHSDKAAAFDQIMFAELGDGGSIEPPCSSRTMTSILPSSLGP
jgi:hypothetical protein